MRQVPSVNDDPGLVRKQYLGDGVYVGYDGYHIVLSLDAQPPTSPTRIGLDPNVMSNLKEYEAMLARDREQIREEFKELREEST